jgi:DNA replication protein DnaC
VTHEPERIADLAGKARKAMERAQARRVPEPETSAPALSETEALRLRALRAASWVPERFLQARPEDLAPEVREVVEGWVSCPDGRNLVVVGPVGSGKSHLIAAALLAGYIEHGNEARFRWSSTATLLERERPDAEEDDGPSLAVCRAVPILGLDDLGAERDTEWGQDRMRLLAADRWDHGRPMAVTTNLQLGPDGPLAARYGERTYSRLVGGAVVLKLIDHDRRRTRR